MIKRTRATITMIIDGEKIQLTDDVTIMTFDDNQDEKSRDEAMRFAARAMLKDKIKRPK